LAVEANVAWGVSTEDFTPFGISRGLSGRDPSARKRRAYQGDIELMGGSYQAQISISQNLVQFVF
jgi:hypothetical protein